MAGYVAERHAVGNSSIRVGRNGPGSGGSRINAGPCSAVALQKYGIAPPQGRAGVIVRKPSRRPMADHGTAFLPVLENADDLLRKHGK
jgi:hypothetical protein